MGAWNKLFSDKSKVQSTATVKGTDGITRQVKLVVGAGGLTDKDFADAVRAGGATLSESRKDTLPNGDVVTKRNMVKSDEITPSQAHAAVCDLLAVNPEPATSRKRPEPSVNGTTAPEPAGK